MTEPFWIDGYSYKHKYNKDDPNNHKAYQDCANDEKCAKQITIDYLTRYATDCDGNGQIDCYDYAGMHKWGPFGGCQKNPIVNSGSYYTSLKTCLECSNQQCLSSSTELARFQELENRIPNGVIPQNFES
ncbi:invertebrate-type lysozyme 3-like isoform X2 [Planococcus citri]